MSDANNVDTDWYHGLPELCGVCGNRTATKQIRAMTGRCNGKRVLVCGACEKACLERPDWLVRQLQEAGRARDGG